MTEQFHICTEGHIDIVQHIGRHSTVIRGESYNFTGSVACDVEDTGNGFIARFPSDSSVKPGDRIAQAMVVPVGRVQFTEVDELGTTARGTGGFGSTGV